MTADVAVTRVVLTARAASDAARLLREAVDLAHARHAELAGVFVEESDLLRLAALPITREVGLASGTVREIDTAATLRELERQATEFRRILARVATGQDVPWSFRVARGSVLEVAVAAVEPADVVMLALPVGLATRALGAPPGSSRPTVTVVYDGGPAADRALARAVELTRGHPEAVGLAVPDGADPLPLRRRAAGQLGLAGTLPDAVALRDLRRRPGRRALVVPGGHGVTDLRRLAAAAECPLVLVG